MENSLPAWVSSVSLCITAENKLGLLLFGSCPVTNSVFQNSLRLATLVCMRVWVEAETSKDSTRFFYLKIDNEYNRNEGFRRKTWLLSFDTPQSVLSNLSSVPLWVFPIVWPVKCWAILGWVSGMDLCCCTLDSAVLCSLALWKSRTWPE